MSSKVSKFDKISEEFVVGKEKKFVEERIKTKQDGSISVRLVDGLWCPRAGRDDLVGAVARWLTAAEEAGYQRGRADGIREAKDSLRASGGHSNGALKEFFGKRLKQCEDMVEFLNQVLAEHRAHASDTEQNIRSAEARMSVYQNLMDELLGEGK